MNRHWDDVLRGSITIPSARARPDHADQTRAIWPDCFWGLFPGFSGRLNEVIGLAEPTDRTRPRWS
jgi:hypothetical protein